MIKRSFAIQGLPAVCLLNKDHENIAMIGYEECSPHTYAKKILSKLGIAEQKKQPHHSPNPTFPN